MRKLIILVCMTFLLFLIGCSSLKGDSFEQKLQGDQLTHIHGMGYDKNGRLIFGTHAGVKFYENGKWFETTKNINDYMGFNVVDKGFYTSGHPGIRSDLPNPIGIQRSLDGGKSLESVGFVGEVDFHLLSVGYKSHDIFLYNPKSNSTLERGLYLGNSEGENWKMVNSSDKEGEYLDLAVHPNNSNLLAVTSVGGVYLSEDGGQNFKLLTERKQGIGVYFSEDTLYYSTFDGSPSLISYDLKMQEKTVKNLPELGKDAPMDISQNPKNPNELAIHTYSSGNVYITKNGTKTWNLISKSGRVK